MTLSRLVDGLRAQGCDVSLVRPRRRTDASALAHELLVPGLPIPGYAGLRFGLPVVGQLRRQWRRQRPDVVHIATEGPLGWAALHVARSLNIPVASTFHTNFHRYCAHYRVGWLRGLVTRHLRTFHNRSAFTMVPNAALQATLQQEGYRNVAVLGRGVDTGLFHPARKFGVARSMGCGRRRSCGDSSAVWRRKRICRRLRRLSPNRAAIPCAHGVGGRWPGHVTSASSHPHHVFVGVQLGSAGSALRLGGSVLFASRPKLLAT